jgi:bifunctional non-homologous end joining protein LigD
MTDRTIDPTATPTAKPTATATATPTAAPDALAALAGLRPQPFGNGHPGRVLDPLIEPLWTGVRALAAIDARGTALVGEAGEPIAGHPDVAAALADATLAEGVILDGFLTKLAVRDGSGVYVALDSLPSTSQMVARPLLGIRPTRAEEVTKTLEAAREARTFGPDDTVRFIAIDLLWLDGESLLDVPLLERRRLLDSAVVESDLVRRGVFVRPPIEAWIGSWRSLGFLGLSYRAANSRYQPGEATDDWVSAPMPRR